MSTTVPTTIPTTICPAQLAGDGSLIATGELHPPIGRRRTWMLLVKRCPLCGYAHTHRADVVRPTYRRAPLCGHAAEYRVDAVRVWRQRRGAA